MSISKTIYNCATCVVKNCDLKVLSPDELGLLDNHSVCIEIDKGDTLFKQGRPLEHIFYLKRGYLKLYNIKENGSEVIININKPGDFIGVNFFLENRKYSCTAKSLTNAEVCYITPELFESFLQSNSTFSYRVLTNIRKENNLLRDKLKAELKCRLSCKVARSIVYLSDNVFIDTDFEMPLSVSELSQYVGASREKVSSVLSQLKKKRYISISRGKVKIENRKELSLICKES